jgi:hypothetical protein
MALIFVSLVLLSGVCLFSVQAQTEISTLNYPNDGEITYSNYNSSFMPWTRKEAIVPLWINFTTQNNGTYESIGKSSAPQGWDIVAFKFGNQSKPAIMINSYLHGNEQYGYEVLYALANWLVSNDTAANNLLENNYFVFVPVVDYRWARTNYNYQNVSEPYIDVDDNQPSGVDLNRNFSPSWSNASIEQQYSGTAPDSEPESQALINAWNKYQPRIYWTLHHGSTRVYTEAIATTAQQKYDIDNLKTLLPTIAENAGVSNDSFKIYVQTAFGACYGGAGKGFAIDGASSHGALGLITELKTSWIYTDDVLADLNSGDTFKLAKTLLVSMAETLQISPPQEQPTQTPSPSPTSTATQKSGTPPTLTPTTPATELPSSSTSPETTLEPSKEASPFVPGNITWIAFVLIIVTVAGLAIAVNFKKRKT